MVASRDGVDSELKQGNPNSSNNFNQYRNQLAAVRCTDDKVVKLG